MDFFTQTQNMIDDAKEFFKRYRRPVATMAIAATAVFLPSCETPSTYGSFSRTVVTNTPNGRVVEKQTGGYNIRDYTKAAKDTAAAMREMARAAKTLNSL